MTTSFRNCLILKTQDVGEDSFFVKILHPFLGKQEFLAKGGKKIAAKLTPALQPLTLVNLWVVPGRNQLGTIIEVEVKEEFISIKRRFLPLRFSLRALDIIDKVTYPFIDSQELFESTTKILYALRVKEVVADLKKLWIWFELSVLRYLGIKPENKTLLRYTSLNHLARHLEKRIYQALR